MTEQDPRGEHLGTRGERLHNLKARMIEWRNYGTAGRPRYSYRFLDTAGNCLIWRTTVRRPARIGQPCRLTGTVRGHFTEGFSNTKIPPRRVTELERCIIRPRQEAR